jgi:hypothetical protein
MNIKEMLAADFGIEVKIASGSGLRAHPYVIEACSAAEAVRTQLNLLRGLGRGRRELWRLLSVETPVGENAGLQAVRIEAVRFPDEEIVTEKRALYFDITAVEGVPDAAAPVVDWSDIRSAFAAVSQVGWLHFDWAIDNAAGRNALDTSLFYSGAGAKATIYVYDPDPSYAGLSPTEVRTRELTAVCSEVQLYNPGAEMPWPTLISGPFALQHFLIGDDLSVVGIALLGPHLLKLRLTYFDDLKMRELMNATLHEFAALVTAHQDGQ